MMRRNAAFRTREPLRHDDNLILKHTTGSLRFLNPTHARYAHAGPDSSATDNHEKSKSAPLTQEHHADHIAFEWRSRDNRKGRHTLVVKSSDSQNAPYAVPESTQTFEAVVKGVGRMFTQYPFWDISWLVAVIFTLGSVIWVFNAFFVFLPLVQPQTEFAGEITTGGGVTAFIGAAVFEIGSVLLMIEAVNENRSGCFGWALRQAVDNTEHGSTTKVEPIKGGCRHHHTNKKNFVGKGLERGEKAAGSSTSSSEVEADTGQSNNWNSSAKETFQFVPSWHDLTHHYIFDLGFLACSAQFFGATVFFISGFTALPSIYDMLLSQGAIDGAYWAPQVIGGSGFVVSSLLFMIETQKSWWKPNLRSLGWHIGFWNFIGSIGFCGCGALGLAYLSTEAQLAASAFTFFGSWAFLIGSVIQWYESLDTHPVEEMKHEKSAGS